MFFTVSTLSMEIVLYYVDCLVKDKNVKNYGSIYLLYFLKNYTCIYSVTIVHTSLGYYLVLVIIK